MNAKTSIDEFIQANGYFIRRTFIPCQFVNQLQELRAVCRGGFTYVGAIHYRLPKSVLPSRTMVQPCSIASLRSEEHTSELQSLMRISYAVFCLKKKKLIAQKTIT